MLAFLLLLASDPSGTPFDTGKAAYEAVDLEGAVVAFERALPEAATDLDRATLHAWIGLCHAQLGRNHTAVTAFRAALRFDRNVKLPARASPDVVAMLESERAELPPLPMQNAQAEISMATWIIAGVGAGLVVAGGAIFAVGLDTALRQPFEQQYYSEAEPLVYLGYTEYAVGGAVAAVGAVALGAAFFIPRE